MVMTAQRAEVLDSAYVRDRAFMVERHLKAPFSGSKLHGRQCNVHHRAVNEAEARAKYRRGEDPACLS